ncbi:MAG: universal stress protein [Deltaproteobacteria bacterium]|nr:universal stress protein [Deltaproteobacteria bacterium]
MKKVLLAIGGIAPSKKVFSYAVELCERIRAELDILQIIRPKQYREYLKRVRQGSHHAKGYIERTMTAAAFAEAGEHELAKEIEAQALESFRSLLPESERAGVPCHLTMKSGHPDEEVLNYTKEHRDVVLTIYDLPKEEENDRSLGSSKKRLLREIKDHIPTPLVMMRG